MLGVIYLILCMLIGKELAGLLLSKKIGYNQIWLTLAAAFGTEDVGVDVELIRTGKQKIAQRFFAEDERKYLEKCWTDEAFTGIWTRKEAYIKAVGTGIAMSLDSFSTMEEQVGEYYLKTWNVERDVWLSVCRKGSAIERCLPEKIALEQVFL